MLLLSPGHNRLVRAQFACTLSGASDEDTCLQQYDDSGSEFCVWCSLNQFGFCLNEAQAEAMENFLPSVACDRNNDQNDDDAAPPPHDDDHVTPNDDQLPDNYWLCLQQKDAVACTTAQQGCTWCRTKAGFGICLSGPSAESAKHSDWFDCSATTTTTTTAATTELREKRFVTAFVYNDDEEVDEEVDEQVEDEQVDDLKDAFWAAPDASFDEPEHPVKKGFVSAGVYHGQETIQKYLADPYDTSCAVVYIQDPTPESCHQALDQDGNPCQWCSLLAGMIPMCLTKEQADLLSDWGVTCDDGAVKEQTEDYEEEDSTDYEEVAQDENEGAGVNSYENLISVVNMLQNAAVEA